MLAIASLALLAAAKPPTVDYRLTVDLTALTGYTVEIRLGHLPDTVRLAMAAHPEYDDRYWRFVRDLSIEGAAGPVVREDSAVWRFVAPGHRAVVRYRIELPPPEPGDRASWRPFLEPTGALLGGPHSFMYVLGGEAAASRVTLDLPADWTVATALEPTPRPRVFTAPSVEALMEGPILAGRLRSWGFSVEGVPHRVVYWPAPDAAPFDTVAFVGQVESLAREAAALFGRPHYREYTFLFQDRAYGGLEHPASVTLGAPSRRLAESPSTFLEETAHEFFHTWNLMRIRPVEYGPVTHRTQVPVSGLWFSEGLTMFYADLLPRRAGLPVEHASRAAHLESLIARYLHAPGHSRFSAEQVSRVAYNAAPGALGDYGASTHLQGELIGAMLDLVIRDATDGRRSMDDVMRAMLARHGGARGFDGRDVEAAVTEVCGCDVHPFFESHVRGAAPIEFDRWLALVGLRARVEWIEAIDDQGRPAADLRLWGRQRGDTLTLVLNDPSSVWGRAGLHTGDRLVSIGGAPVRTWPELRRVLAAARMGDTLRLAVDRPGPWTTDVVMRGYRVPRVYVEPIPDATRKAVRLREQWGS